ncbi:hypothetical protein A2856_00390 [Candidatus Uhrbacteria bacterium RIFCSPHIGHO2_01_FULL_63_20]|uniref:Uncharacterized protein n=1 Tax=Candidatus Uhrbacteria bacterium RIFCSPHIGHO2_01_FULL_63_20 TaxID=1802385 RepID=A0A1F7TN46_9BACT|nr:MAG: hypothetical protein A2856_00390 [Candidatus Uhrbacteria bacterium RIFCSPHIGHO2_01_FULL_63_20]
MKKPLILTLLGAALVAVPFTGSVRADAGGFRPIMATSAWNYGAYRVEKLAFSERAVGPFTIKDSVFVAEPEDGCLANCQLYTLNLIKDGSVKAIPHVPASAFSELGLRRNANRLVFADRADLEGLRYDVVEVDVKTLAKKTLAKGVFAKNASKVTPVVDGSTIFLELEFPLPLKNGLRQQAVFLWDPEESVARPITQHWELNREEIQDVIMGFALVKMTFPSGQKQLWLMHGYEIDHRKGEMKDIPGTWTEADGDIVGAHFAGFQVEFFRNYTRYTWPFDSEQPAVAHAGDTLSWFRGADAALQVTDAGSVWVDAQDQLHVSEYGKSRTLGIASFGRFHAEGSKVYFATDFAGKSVSGRAAAQDTNVAILDMNGTKAVGVNSFHQVAYLDLATGLTHDIGTGRDPVVDQDGRAYWHGVTSGIYSATFVPGPSVKAVSNKDASGHFVKGTRVKFEGKARVFVVGADLRLHSLPDETTAFQLFGRDWNKGIVTVKETQMIDYPLGDILRTSGDLAKM